MDPYLASHGDETFDVESYDIGLDYRVSSNHLDGHVDIVAVARVDLDRIGLDLHALEVGKVTVDGRRPAKHTTRADKLRIVMAEPVSAGDRFVVAIRYAGPPRPLRSRWGDVGWEELTDGVIVASQPSGAPTWFPCNDRPSNKAAYRLSVTTESAYTVVASGRLAERNVGASRTTWVYEQVRPTASYLATVQIGRYGVITQPGSDGGVGQQLVVPDRLRDKAIDDFDRQPQMMAAFEEWFGPYPFDHYTAVVTDDDLEIPLEAQGLSIFGANHVDGAKGSERLVAHELAHQWFGNCLTLGLWRDIWLHEGFACYAEWLWSERSGGPSADDLARRHHRRLAGLAQDLVIADPGPALMFDDRLYKRGALTLHAIRLRLGDQGFFAMVLDWVEQHRYGTVDTASFVAQVERHAGSAGDDLAQVLSGWLDQPELPALGRRRR